MTEVVNVAVALVVIYFIVRWATGSSGNDSSPDAAAERALRFKPKRVTPEMIENVATMFPDLPRANIHYDLLRTGSTEQTANKILQRGFLEAPPPAYFTLYPNVANGQQQHQAHAPRPNTAGATTTARKAPETLISRFHLEERVASTEVVDSDAGGKAAWEDTAEKREASLRERKRKMILAARQRLLEKQQKEATKAD